MNIVTGGWYNRIWKSLIKPDRAHYSPSSFGPEEQQVGQTWYSREDVELPAILNYRIHTSLFLPDLTGDSHVASSSVHPQKHDVVLYLHTHSGNRMQGWDYLEMVEQKQLGLCVFDFHGNGKSEGDYVTFGWTETIDVDCVVKWLKRHPKVNNIILWGRSMGAVTTIFYMSTDFRTRMLHWLARYKKVNGYQFQSPETIKGVILDSPFMSLEDSILHFTNKKVSGVPNWV
jgi:alpha/beta superfamily hydrolase